jgi:RimJ/RimL family protein N-acetyltransferase
VALALGTDRLLLRQWREDDVEPFAAMSADPEVMAMLMPRPDRAACEAAAAQMRAHWARHGFGLWIVEAPGEAAFVGLVGLSTVGFAAPFAPAVEIGWRLARPFWGRGYAEEAARAAIEDGFARLGLTEIVAFTVPANRRSWRLMERLGMKRDEAGDFDHPAVPEGHRLRRHVLYRLRRRTV